MLSLEELYTKWNEEEYTAIDKYCSQADRKNKIPIEFYLTWLGSLIYLNKFEKAEYIIKESEIFYPNDYRIIRRKGDIYFHKGELKKSKNYYIESINISSDEKYKISTITFVIKNLIEFLISKEINSFLKESRTSIKMGKSYWLPFLSFMEKHYHIGEWTFWTREIIRQYPELDHQIHVFNYALKVGAFDHVERLLTEGMLTQLVNDWGIHWIRARLEAMRGNYDDAEKAAQLLIDSGRSKYREEAFFMLGWSAFHKGTTDVSHHKMAINLYRAQKVRRALNSGRNTLQHNSNRHDVMKALKLAGVAWEAGAKFEAYQLADMVKRFFKERTPSINSKQQVPAIGLVFIPSTEETTPEQESHLRQYALSSEILFLLAHDLPFWLLSDNQEPTVPAVSETSDDAYFYSANGIDQGKYKEFYNFNRSALYRRQIDWLCPCCGTAVASRIVSYIPYKDRAHVPPMTLFVQFHCCGQGFYLICVGVSSPSYLYIPRHKTLFSLRPYFTDFKVTDILARIETFERYRAQKDTRLMEEGNNSIDTILLSGVSENIGHRYHNELSAIHGWFIIEKVPNSSMRLRLAEPDIMEIGELAQGHIDIDEIQFDPNMPIISSGNGEPFIWLPMDSAAPRSLANTIKGLSLTKSVNLMHQTHAIRCLFTLRLGRRRLDNLPDIIFATIRQLSKGKRFVELIFDGMTRITSDDYEADLIKQEKAFVSRIKSKLVEENVYNVLVHDIIGETFMDKVGFSADIDVAIAPKGNGYLPILPWIHNIPTLIYTHMFDVLSVFDETRYRNDAILPSVIDMQAVDQSVDISSFETRTDGTLCISVTSFEEALSKHLDKHNI